MMEIILPLIGTIVTVIISIAMLAYWLGKRLTEIEGRFNQRLTEIEGKFNQRFTEIEGKFNERLNEMEKKFNERLNEMEKEFGEIYGNFKSINLRLNGLEEMIRGSASASTEAHRVITDFLALKGLIDKAEAEYLSARVRGVFQAYALNPLSEEERRFILDLFSKDVDEATIEEAEKAYQIGLKLFREKLDSRGFLLAMAASYLRGYLISREVRKSKKKNVKKK